MLLFNIQQTSVDQTVEYIDHLKERLLVGIRLGMRDGVRGLAQAEAAAAAPHNKTGHLAQVLAKAGKVIESGDEITAVYKPRSPGKQEHYWLEYGADIPAVERTLMHMEIQGDQVFRSAHKEFRIPAHPFFFSTAEAYANRWFEILSTRVDEALHA